MKIEGSYSNKIINKKGWKLFWHRRYDSEYSIITEKFRSWVKLRPQISDNKNLVLKFIPSTKFLIIGNEVPSKIGRLYC